jgi:hypothetical protein
MKKQVLYFLLSPLSLVLFAASDVDRQIYNNYAKQWCASYIVDEHGELRITHEELDAITDLINLSAERAAITLEAQTGMLKTIELLWHAWENLVQTRLNPSHQRPYVIDRAERNEAKSFWDLAEAQAACCKAYSATAERVVHGDILQSRYAKDAVAQMRAQARVYMVDALSDVKKQLGSLYDLAFHKSFDQLAEDIGEEASLHKKIAFGEYLLSYIPNLALHSFIQADKTHNLVTSEGWSVLYKIQQIGNLVWGAIEQARYEFYQALLDEIKITISLRK